MSAAASPPLDIGPVRFTSFLRPMVWGGVRLAQNLGKPIRPGETYGEAWEVSDHAAHVSVVANGPWTGRTLRWLMTEQRQALLGKAAPALATFPWLVKLLEARDWLSVQVHPDDEKARRLWPGEGGKTEAWFVLDADPGSRIYAGLLPGVDEQALRAALGSGTVADCLHSFVPRAGDCVFLPAGTVHAVGGGVFFAEVQQTSDATFRLFDWNRRDAAGHQRALHIEEALACIDWKQGAVGPRHVEDFAGSRAARRLPLVRCRYFELDYVEEVAPFACGGQDRLQALIVTRGSGRLTGPWGEEVLVAGQTWVFPAALALSSCVPDSVLGGLLCSLPDPDRS